MARRRVAPYTPVATHLDNRIVRELDKAAILWRGKVNVVNAALLALFRLSDADQMAAMAEYARFAGDPKQAVKAREAVGAK